MSGKKKDYPKKNQKEKITDFFEYNEAKNFSRSHNSILYKEIDKLIETFDQNQKVISSFKKQFDQLKAKIDAKNKIAQEHENEMEKIAIHRGKLNVIYEAMKLKLLNIQSTKKKKYYGEFFEKSKKVSSNYREIFDKNIDILKKKLNVINPIRAKIKKNNKEIADTIKIMDRIDEGISYPGKNEYKNDFGNLFKKIESDIGKEECEKTDSNAHVDEIIKKFNDAYKRITQEKEELD